MTRRIALLLAAALTVAATCVAAPGFAQAQNRADPQDSLGADWAAQQDQARAGVKQGRYVPLYRVIAEIRKRTPGRQLDAGLEQAGGRAVYRVRWATADGRRIDYIVDAETGAIISAR